MRWRLRDYISLVLIGVYLFSLMPIASSGGVLDLQRWVFRPSAYWLVAYPWTAVSYALIHADLWHLVVNLLVLDALSRHIGRQGRKRLLLLSLLSIVLGALSYLLGYTLLGSIGVQLDALALVGSSSALIGLYTFGTLCTPGAVIKVTPWGTLRMWHFAILIVGLSLISVHNAGGILAHIGGACGGAIFYYALRYRTYRQLTRGKQPSATELIDRARRSGLHSLTHAERQRLRARSRQ